MTPEQWEVVTHTIVTAADTAQLVALTLIPLMYVYVVAVHGPDLVHQFLRGDRDHLPNTWRSSSRHRWSLPGRPLSPAEPTLLLRDIPAPGMALYAPGPRPIVAVARFGRLSVTRERFTFAERRPRTRPVRVSAGGRHRA